MKALPLAMGSVGATAWLAGVLVTLGIEQTTLLDRDFIESVGIPGAIAIGLLVVMWKLFSPIARAQTRLVEETSKANAANAASLRKLADAQERIAASMARLGESQESTARSMAHVLEQLQSMQRGAA